MKTSLILVALTMTATLAQADAALAQKNACMACHAVDKKVLGPAFKDVAAKYSSDKQAESKLVASIKAGGSGKWGPVPMPAQTALSEPDSKALAKWILSLAK